MVVLLSAAVLAGCLSYTHGHVLFSLDDPYIHLALAERLMHGHYGLNPGEMAAPASSILYPFLLTPLVALGLGQWACLLIGFVSTLASGWLVCSILDEVGIAPSRLSHASLAMLCVAFLLAFNLIWLEFTGLEHSLMVTVTLAGLLGLVRFLRRGRVETWWLTAALADPLIRYEGATLWIGIVGILLLHRRWLPGSLLLVLGTGALVGFSVFLHSNGLGWLPSSVLTKSSVAVAGTSSGLVSLLKALDQNFQNNLHMFAATLLFVAGAVVGYGVLGSWRRPAASSRAQYGALALAVIGGHMLGGRFGGFARYEVYVMVFAVVLAMVVHADAVSRWVGRARRRDCAYVATALMLALLFNTKTAFIAPSAARDVYQQQFQMHRMAVDFYRAPIAVNDLGWTSFENPNYVLDLGGLGSEEARQARLRPDPRNWLGDLVRHHDVGLVMVYSEWYPVVPANWVKVAVLTTPQKVTVAFNDVTFYATSAAAVAKVKAALQQLRVGLPAADRLDTNY